MSRRPTYPTYGYTVDRRASSGGTWTEVQRCISSLYVATGVAILLAKQTGFRYRVRDCHRQTTFSVFPDGSWTGRRSDEGDYGDE